MSCSGDLRSPKRELGVGIGSREDGVADGIGHKACLTPLLGVPFFCSRVGGRLKMKWALELQTSARGVIAL